MFLGQKMRMHARILLLLLLSMLMPALMAAEAAPLYVDVRTAEEFASGHVAGALNIPHSAMQRRWKELEPYKDKQLIVYCRSGRRSAIALEVLRGKGFSKVENGGAFERLAAKGIPTAR